MILKNVELLWAKLDPARPDGGFDGNTPQWNLVAVTRDKDQAKQFKAANLNVKTDEDDTGIIYKVSLKKLATLKNGDANKPVPTVGPDLMPLEDPSVIGNGSVANVKIRQFDYDFNGKKGVGTRLEAVQITRLVEYKSAGNPILEGFEPVAADDNSNDAADPFA